MARDKVLSAPTRIPKLLTEAFPSGFVKHLSVPWWLQIDFPVASDSAIPPEGTARL